ncbi:MAG: BlaI/MecI/CopY family transcriptional regulator [Lachnospiraceae bacterium]|nr:BlaI/MecI/CopY family transcriptional regulator [Lachnospiraceae bacterium]
MGRVDSKEIGTRQQQIMQCIWEAGGRSTVPEIIERLERKAGIRLTRQAVNTFLLILMEKGFLAQGPKEGKAYIYIALISEDEFRRSELERIEKLTYGGSPSALVATMLETEISDEELKKIKRLMDQL